MISRLPALIFTLSLVHAAEPIALTGHAMGTTWAVKYHEPDPPAAPLDPHAVTARIVQRLEQLEQQFSLYRPSSELSRFNASTSTAWQSVSPELAQVALESRRLSELTGGAFDATVEPLVRLWGFGPQRRTDTLPSANALAAARARVDYRRLEIRLSPPALRKLVPDVSADFSSMAKGFASDAVSDLLTSLNTASHLVQVGGDVRTSGRHVWRTGIENPVAAASTPFSRIIALTGQALSTSGNTHNFIQIAGRRYGHILDPRTGRPVSGPLASVSVVHTSCALSSALATALFVLGPDAGLALAEREHVACLFLIHQGDTTIARTTVEFQRLSEPSSGPSPSGS